MSDPLLLCWDTSAAHCAATLFRGDVALAAHAEAMGRGQAEALMPALERLLAQAGADWADLTALGVGIGPGNFTGVRISVAAARGLSLALEIPAIGISTFDLIRDGSTQAAAELVSVPAPRDMAHVQPYGDGRPAGAPRLIDPADPPQDLHLPVTMRVIGHRAAEIARALGTGHQEATLEDLPRRLGRVTGWKWRNGIDTDRRPAPLYVRPADAAPPADPPPVPID